MYDKKRFSVTVIYYDLEVAHFSMHGSEVKTVKMYCMSVCVCVCVCVRACMRACMRGCACNSFQWKNEIVTLTLVLYMANCIIVSIYNL